LLAKALFDLLIPHRPDSRRVRIVWRKQADVGVRLLDDIEGRPSLKAARRTDDLKKQNVAVAIRVADLREPEY